MAVNRFAAACATCNATVSGVSVFRQDMRYGWCVTPDPPRRPAEAGPPGFLVTVY